MTDFSNQLYHELSDIKAGISASEIKNKCKQHRNRVAAKALSVCMVVVMAVILTLHLTSNTDNIFTITTVAAENGTAQKITDDYPTKISIDSDQYTLNIIDGNSIQLADDDMWGYTTSKHLFSFFGVNTQLKCTSDTGSTIRSITYKINGKNAVLCSSKLNVTRYQRTNCATINYDDQDKAVLLIGFAVDNDCSPFTENDIEKLRKYSREYNRDEFERYLADLIKDQYASMTVDVTVTLDSGEKYTKTLVLEYDVAKSEDATPKAVCGQLLARLK